MRSDLVQCIHIDMPRWCNGFQSKCQTWDKESVSRAIFTKYIGFKNLNAFEYITFDCILI